MDREFEVLKYTRDKHPESHIHEFYEVFLAISDAGRFFVKEKGYALKQGTVFFLPPFEIHRCFGHDEAEYERYVIHFTEDYLSSVSTVSTSFADIFRTAPHIIQLSDGELSSMTALLDELLLPQGSELGADIERRIRFQEFLLLLARSMAVYDGPLVPAVENRKLINDMLRYIHEHYQEDLSLETLGKTFYLSRSRLSQLFRTHTGFSVGDYIITYRIKKACALLKNGVSVQDTAEQTGYRNVTHFIRIFKKRTGISPGQFARGREETVQ